MHYDDFNFARGYPPDERRTRRTEISNDNCESGYYEYYDSHWLRALLPFFFTPEPFVDPALLSFHLEIALTSSLFRIFMPDRSFCKISSSLREQLSLVLSELLPVRTTFL